MGRGLLDGLCGVGGVCACGLGRVRSQRILILASICGLLTFFSNIYLVGVDLSYYC
jgi:hypothetical protein